MAFRLVCELLRQIDKAKDKVVVWDDESPATYREQMSKLVEVHVHPVNQHLGDHRNAAKSVVPENEWIIMLDADELIQPGFIPATRAQTEYHPDVDAIFFERWNTWWEDIGSPDPPEPPYEKKWQPDYQPRGFRNTKRVHFLGQIHSALFQYDWPLYLRGKPFTILHHKPKGDPPYVSWPTK
jgi:hypothetical protein